MPKLKTPLLTTSNLQFEVPGTMQAKVSANSANRQERALALERDHFAVRIVGLGFGCCGVAVGADFGVDLNGQVFML